MDKKLKIAPSILSANFQNLKEDIKKVELAGADYIHCDVMDGCFVPNITFGPLIIEAVKKITTLPLDVHLMINNPENHIEAFRKAGSDIITVHAEACNGNLEQVINQIKKSGAKVGVSVNPDKPVELFLPYLNIIDQVLLMSVYAGAGGQKFMPEVLEKVKKVDHEIQKLNLSTDIEIDGGVNDKTVNQIIDAGVNVLVAGSYVFNSEDYEERINKLRALP